MKKVIIVYRLFNPTYGLQGNSKTLSVILREDNTLSYVYYGGWQSSGIRLGFAISNMQLKESLPINISQFKGSAKALDKKIQEILATGIGSVKISSYEILNNIPTIDGLKLEYEKTAQSKYKDVVEPMKMLQIQDNAISNYTLNRMLVGVAFKDADSDINENIYYGSVFQTILENHANKVLVIDKKYLSELNDLNELCKEYQYVMVTKI